MENTNSGKNIPEKKFSTGVISATIWKNNGTSKRTGESVEFRTITLQRRYTDKDGKWQTSSNMRINDLPKASLVLQKAYEYLVLRGAQSASQDISDTKEEIVM